MSNKRAEFAGTPEQGGGAVAPTISASASFTTFFSSESCGKQKCNGKPKCTPAQEDYCKYCKVSLSNAILGGISSGIEE